MLDMRIHLALQTGALASALVFDPQAAFALGFSELEAKVTSDGWVHVFGVDSDSGDSATHLWQGEPDGPWEFREVVGGIHRDLTALARADGRFEVYGVGTDGGIWRSWQPADSWIWSPWESLGGSAKNLAAASDSERAALFYFAADDVLTYAFRDGADGAWSEWVSDGFVGERLAVVGAGDGSFELFAIGSEDEVWQGRLDPAAGGPIDWRSLGGQAGDVAVARAADGELELIAAGFDGAVFHNREVDGAFGGWESLGGSARRVALAVAGEQWTLFALAQDGQITRATRGQEAVWSEWSDVPEAEPLDVTFDGEALVEIPDQDVSEGGELELGVRFSVDRRHVVVVSFPPITTEPFDTPFGSSRSTVSMVEGGRGTFEPESGRLQLPLTMRFDQSLDVPLVNEDVTARLPLSTEGHRGHALAPDSGDIALGAVSTFDGIGGGINPLDGLEVRVSIAGSLNPRP
jgi:hypothetical protein